MLISPNRSRVRVSAFALLLAAGTALAFAVLIAGRSVPWQGGRLWAITFAAAFLVSSPWWWRFGREVELAHPGASNRTWLALAWGTMPVLPSMLAGLLLVYLSDQANQIFEQPGWRPLATLSFAILAAGTWSMQRAAVEWLRDPRGGLSGAMARTFQPRAAFLVPASLLLIGVLQAAASVGTSGDDIGHYVSAADALMARQPYPLDSVAPELVAAGMAPLYPAVPFFPILLALSFMLFGHTVLAVAVPNLVMSAVFPVVFYLACRSLAGSRAISYFASAALSFFPLFQIHFLGVPEADTTFEVLLLLSVVFAARASTIGGVRNWIGMGLMLGLSALTRPEGLPYSAVIFAPFFLFLRFSGGVWLAVLAEALTLAPYAITIYGRTGSLWPTTFGSGSIGFENLARNGAVLNWPAIPWYGQAVGVGGDLVVPLFLGFLLASALGAVTLLRDKPVLVGVPLAGLGNMAVVFLMNPRIVSFFNPPEGARHVFMGFPLACLGVVCLGAVVLKGVTHLTLARRSAVTLVLGAFACVLFWYDVDRLARPEPYFGGSASLLWTGGGVTLPDLMATRVDWPYATDVDNWEKSRGELQKPYERVSLKALNLSEPYYWTSLLVALAGLVVALAEVAASSAPGTDMAASVRRRRSVDASPAAGS